MRNLRYRRGVPRWQRIYLTSCAAAICFCLAYLASDFGQWPRLTYFPYEGVWRWFRTPPGTVPMNYVGTFMWGVVGLAAGATLGFFGCRLCQGSLSDRVLRMWGGWALSAFVFVGLYFTWNLWPF